jgi:hypothetical protein
MLPAIVVQVFVAFFNNTKESIIKMTIYGTISSFTSVFLVAVFVLVDDSPVIGYIITLVLILIIILVFSILSAIIINLIKKLLVK